MDHINIYENGSLDPRCLYLEKFKKIPDEYAQQFKRGVRLDFTGMTPATVEDILENSIGSPFEVITMFTKSPKLGSSSISREKAENDPDLDIEYSGCTARGGYVDPGFYVIDADLSIIYAVDCKSILALYDHTIAKLDLVRNFIEELYDHLPLVDKDETTPPSTVQLINYSNGFYTTDAEIASTTVDVDRNYNDDFKAAFDDITSFLDRGFRHSGIIMLHGEPGCGKTWLIKHLMTHVPNKYVYVGVAEAGRLSSPDFKEFLIDHQNCVFIIEDCEALLQDRKASSLSATLSTVLNMSDGILGDIFNAKFICTYNGAFNIDEALLRPGRCFADYEFKKLDAAKADVILETLGKSRPEGEDGPMSLAEIFNTADVAKTSKAKKRKIGF